MNKNKKYEIMKNIFDVMDSYVVDHNHKYIEQGEMFSNINKEYWSLGDEPSSVLESNFKKLQTQSSVNSVLKLDNFIRTMQVKPVIKVLEFILKLDPKILDVLVKNNKSAQTRTFMFQCIDKLGHEKHLYDALYSRVKPYLSEKHINEIDNKIKKNILNKLSDNLMLKYKALMDIDKLITKDIEININTIGQIISKMSSDKVIKFLDKHINNKSKLTILFTDCPRYMKVNFEKLDSSVREKLVELFAKYVKPGSSMSYSFYHNLIDIFVYALKHKGYSESIKEIMSYYIEVPNYIKKLENIDVNLVHRYLEILGESKVQYILLKLFKHEINNIDDNLIIEKVLDTKGACLEKYNMVKKYC